MSKEQLTKAMDEFIETWRKKGFHEKSLMPLGVLAGCKEGIARFGNTLNSFKALTELVKSSDDEQYILDEFYRMIFEEET